MKNNFDVDIDFKDRVSLLKSLTHVVAKNKDAKHNTGVYFQNIPQNPFTNVATIDYKDAFKYGYFKIDCLNVSVYDGIQDELHLFKLMNAEPIWELLEHESIVSQLFQIKDYGWLLSKTKPKSIEQLAMVLALIRPAKSYLQNLTWDEIKKHIWEKPTDGAYYFKKSHSVGYAVAIVVQLNLIIENTLLTSSN